MISHRHRWIFVHIPKAAGTSIEQALFHDASESCGGQWAKTNRCWRNKLLFELIDTHPDYFVFTVVRNPFDRFVSAWAHLRNLENGIDLEDFLSATEHFLVQGAAELYTHVLNNETRFVDIDPRLAHRIRGFEYPFLHPITGYHVLPQTYFFQKPLDFVGRFENLESDFRTISTAIFGRVLDLPHAQQSEHPPYPDLLGAHQVLRIESLYSEDFQQLGY